MEPRAARLSRHQAESLAHFGWREGDLVITDAGYKVGSSVELTQQSKSVVLQRSCASHLSIQDKEGQSISLRARVRGLAADSLGEFTAWVQLPKSGQRGQVRVLCYRLPEEQARKGTRSQRGQAQKEAWAQVQQGVGVVGQLGDFGRVTADAAVLRWSRSGALVSSAVADRTVF